MALVKTEFANAIVNLYIEQVLANSRRPLI